MITTGLTLDLRHAQHADVLGWATKRQALAVLATLRETGRNVDVEVQAHRAETYLFRFWVLGRPDHYNGITYLMADDGAWVPGRLADIWDGATPWTRLAGATVPAPFTHVTRTVPDSANRHERYRTKSNGSCGRWVITDDSVALCTCGWKTWHPTRADAQAAARTHRAAVA